MRDETCWRIDERTSRDYSRASRKETRSPVAEITEADELPSCFPLRCGREWQSTRHPR